MKAKGRPEREYRSAKHEGDLIRPPGRPKGEYRSAKREGTLLTAGNEPCC
jgi:16S rRNA (guanine527-N7)-methyltransferase